MPPTDLSGHCRPYQHWHGRPGHDPRPRRLQPCRRGPKRRCRVSCPDVLACRNALSACPCDRLGWAARSVSACRLAGSLRRQRPTRPSPNLICPALPCWGRSRAWLAHLSGRVCRRPRPQRPGSNGPRNAPFHGCRNPAAQRRPAARRNFPPTCARLIGYTEPMLFQTLLQLNILLAAAPALAGWTLAAHPAQVIPAQGICAVSRTAAFSVVAAPRPIARAHSAALPQVVGVPAAPTDALSAASGVSAHLVFAAVVPVRPASFPVAPRAP